jgi:hypothetical protein
MEGIMANLKLTDLKNILKEKSKEELITEITELVKIFPVVKEYYAVKVNPASKTETFEKYKRIIQNEFFPDRGFGKMRYSVVNKAISDFKKLSKDTEKIAELMLYYAEIGVDFTETFGDIDEKFYIAIERAYTNAIDYIFKNELQDKFWRKADKIRSNADGIGWGFSDNMNDIYFEYFGDIDEE